MIEDTCGIHFPQEWKSRLKNFVAAVLFEFNGLVQKTTLDSWNEFNPRKTRCRKNHQASTLLCFVSTHHQT